jgi:sec-independent protein translocase protein TatA
MLTLSVILGILGGQELLFILIIVLVLFGGKKIPELMRGLGRGVGEYNKAKKDVLDHLDDSDSAQSKMNRESAEMKNSTRTGL